MIEILQGDCRDVMRSLIERGVKVQCVVTSPPYWGLRDYGVDAQLGLERTYPEFIANMVEVFELVRQLLADDGTLWLNMGDSYATGGGSVGRSPGGGDQGERFLRMGHINTQPNRMPQPGMKPKDLVGIPWRLAFALQDAGWWLRQDIIWSKPNPMPESVRDRCTKAHEYLFLMTKSERYYFDPKGIEEPATGAVPGNKRPNKGVGDPKMRTRDGLHKYAEKARLEDQPTRNKRSVWTVPTRPYKHAHFATFPADLIEPCILDGSRPGDIVFDPFGGSGTTAATALKHGRRAIISELNPSYIDLAWLRVGEVLTEGLV